MVPVEWDAHPIISLLGSLGQAFLDKVAQTLDHHALLPRKLLHGLVHDFRSRDQRF
jgi:hypothetical protein